MEINTALIIKIMKDTHLVKLSHYDNRFLKTSVERRIELLGVASFEIYCQLLHKDSIESDKLLKSLNISYSQFFRNSLTFSLLETQIIPAIIDSKGQNSEIRVWSAGCAAGQEAYSVAMLLDKLIGVSKKKMRYRIFATDVALEALERGKNGIYCSSEMNRITLENSYLYFSHKDDTYTVKNQLRKNISFTYFDLLAPNSGKPPESIYGEFDIVFCSNVLIYYNKNSQHIISEKLINSLAEGGVLVTDNSEKDIINQLKQLKVYEATSSIFKQGVRLKNNLEVEYDA